jgi:cytoskeletal protein CcmA (bactofilin family)
MNDLKMSGVTSASGGVYGNVKIEGVSSISGDIECKDLNVQGVSNFSGGIRCETLKVEGTCGVKADVRAGTAKLYGVLNVDGALEAESFTGSGSFRVGGEINAERVDLKFVYGSSAAEIVGQDIRVHKEHHTAPVEFFLDLVPWKLKGRSLRCKLVEGDAVALEYVECDTVRAQRAVIGPGCVVGTVEYHETADVSPSARVGKLVKLEKGVRQLPDAL